MNRVVAIYDPDDPQIASYRSVRGSDRLARRHVFIVEGVVVLEKVIRSGLYPLASVLLADKHVARLSELLEELSSNVDIFVAGQDVLDLICGFHLHRGVLAAGAAPAPTSPAQLLGDLEERPVVVGLIGVGDADNMGSIFRNAAAFGAAAVLLDSTCCDPLYRRAIRVSVGAALSVPHARLDRGDDLPDLLRERGFEVFAFTPRGTEALKTLQAAPRSALLFGAEGSGLPQDVLDRVRSVRIAMAGGFDSLNVATASGVALHHFLTPV